MRCRSTLTRVDALRTGELPREEHRAVEEHLNTCKSCEDSVADVDELAQAVKALMLIPPRSIRETFRTTDFYDRVEEVVSYPRSWRRGQTFGAERFEKLLAEQRPAARRSQAQQRLLDSLDGLCSRAVVEAYLRDLADTDRSLGRQIDELLELMRQYGPEAVAGAMERAAAARAFGADYVANILRQQQSPRRPQPPLRLRDARLNELVTDPISLLEYDAFILEAGKECDDAPSTEIPAAESLGDEPPH